MMLRFPGLRTLVGVACALALSSVGGRASAVEITGAGQSFDISLDGNIGGTDVAGLTGAASFDVVSFNANQIVLDVTLTNTSNSVLWQSARISAFGFNSDPNIVSASLSSDVFNNVILGGQFPNGFGSIDLCVINNRNNCTGGRNGGLLIGRSETMQLTLNYNGPISSINFDNFGVRYQSLSSSQLGFNGASGTGHGTVSNPIPEPRSTALFLLGGLLVVGVVRKQVLTAR